MARFAFVVCLLVGPFLLSGVARSDTCSNSNIQQRSVFFLVPALFLSWRRLSRSQSVQCISMNGFCRRWTPYD
jgi:hypothetical protein